MENNNNNDTRDKQKIDSMCEIIVRQTDYTKEEAYKKLVDNNYNVLETIRDFMRPSTKNKDCEMDKNKKSTSQIIYSEIRNMMSSAAANYRRKKEMEEKYNDFLEKAREKAQAQAQAQAEQAEQAEQAQQAQQEETQSKEQEE